MTAFKTVTIRATYNGEKGAEIRVEINGSGSVARVKLRGAHPANGGVLAVEWCSLIAQGMTTSSNGRSMAQIKPNAGWKYSDSQDPSSDVLIYRVGEHGVRIISPRGCVEALTGWAEFAEAIKHATAEVKGEPYARRLFSVTSTRSRTTNSRFIADISGAGAKIVVKDGGARGSSLNVSVGDLRALAALARRGDSFSCELSSGYNVKRDSVNDVRLGELGSTWGFFTEGDWPKIADMFDEAADALDEINGVVKTPAAPATIEEAAAVLAGLSGEGAKSLTVTSGGREWLVRVNPVTA